jgi:prophage DNA circulation protein
MSWEEDISVASFRGLSFEVLSIRDSITRRVVEHKFPYRDGASLEDTGREPRPFDIEGDFISDNYLEELINFSKIADEGATGPFVHPLFGTFQAKVMAFDINHEGERRDSATFTLQLKEDGTNTKVPDFSGVESAGDDLTRETETVVSISEEIVEFTPPDDTDWLDLVDRAVEDALAFIDDVDAIVDDLETRFEQMRKTALDAIDEVVAMTDRAVDTVTSVTTPLVQGLHSIVIAAKRLRERAERIKSKIVELPIDVTAPLTTTAMRLYGDASRVDDLVRINKIRNPFLIPAGTRLRVFQE